MSFRTYLQCRQKALAFSCLFLLIIVFQGYQVRAQTASYVWKNAPIGGGGFVTGIITHKTSGDRYCRTDIGGAYRWDAANNKWIQLLDWLDESENGFYGVESLALDPQNPNNVYMLCGIAYASSGRTAILKSTDKGNTFTYTDVTAKFKAHGNGSGRGNGERLVVDPNNSNILFCGTRANGLWKSTDAGVTWNLAWNGVTTTPNGNGICFVVYDPSGSVVGGATQTMYIGVSRTGEGNIYKSTDGGVSFTDITATTGFMPHRAELQGTTMYVTYSDHPGPQSTNGDGKVYKLNTSTGVWTNVTPVHNKDYCYGGVSIDPTNVNRVIVSTSGIYWNNQFGTGWADFIFLSTDGGSTWTLKNGKNATYDANGMEWSSGGAINWMECIEFDQSNVNRVRVVGGGGVFTCPDITATNPSWKYDVVGIEETALLDGISIPDGPFISSFGDVSGFAHEPLTSYPSQKLSPVGGFNNHSIAYASGNPSKVVRIANEGNVVYYSDNKGATWTAAATNMGVSGKVAISADGGTIVHCPAGSTTTYYTTNNGDSWSTSSGVSLGDAAPVADQVNSNYFYVYNPTNGQMLRSSNKGVSFSVAGTPGASTANHPYEPALIRAVPGFEGHVWVPLGRNGLKYSTNYGAAYTTVSNVTYCNTVGIGKAMSGSSYPTIFIWGTVSGVTGLFRSTDQGATWARINDDAHKFAGAPLLIGDMNVAGRVFMSANGGRGLIYWEDNNKRSANWKSAAYTGTGKDGAVKAGDEITYTIHVRNTGSVQLDNLTVIDTVPAHTVFVSADGGITPDANGKLTWTITSIAVGTSDVIRSFTVKVANDLTNVTHITNTADVDNGDGTGQHPTTPPDPSNPNDPKTNPDPNEPSTDVPVDDGGKQSLNWKSVTYTGTGASGKVKPGDQIQYTIHLRNTGHIALTNVVIIDTIPAYTVFVSADGGITPDATGKLTWTITNIPVGSADITRSFTVKVASDLTNAGYITNTAYVDGDPTTPPDPSNPNEPKTNPDPNEPSTEILVDNGKLSLNWKSAQYTPSGTQGGVTTGDLITYTIHIRNTGSIKLENVKIIDTIPAYTEFVSADEGITPDGNKKLSWTIAEIPVGSADITRSFIVKVASELTGATNIINTAGVDNGNGKGNQPTSPPMTNDPGNPDTNPTSGPSTNILVDKLNNWECWKTVVTASGNDKVKPDEELTYTIHIRNTGNVAVDHLVVTDPIPEHTSFVSAGNGGTLDPSTNIVTWNVAAIAVGATTEITMVIKAADNLDSIPVIVNTASATDGTSTKPTSGCDPASPDCTGGTGTSISTIPGDAALVFANAMSPNGDGKNEYFIVKGLDKFPNANLCVFNRWGSMVYQAKDYHNDWNGSGLSEGIYYYKLEIKQPEGTKLYKGWVMIKRK